MKRAILLLVLLSLPAQAKEPVDFRIGVCARELDWTDLPSAHAAAKHLIDRVARKNGLSYSMDFMSRSREVVKLLEDGKVNVGWLLASDYLMLERKHKLHLLARPVLTGRAGFRLKLLVTGDSKVRKLADLKGRSISLHRQMETHHIYLETLVARHGLGRPAEFFGAVKQRKKAKSTVVDLLLGEVDASLVADIVLDTMAELNPQVKKLRVLHASPRFTYPPLFGTYKLPAAKAKQLTRTLTGLHERPQGKQLLLMFRIDRFVRARAEDYKNARALFDEHRRLVKKPSRPQ